MNVGAMPLPGKQSATLCTDACRGDQFGGRGTSPPNDYALPEGSDGCRSGIVQKCC